MLYASKIGSQRQHWPIQSNPPIPGKYKQSFGSPQAVDSPSGEDWKNYIGEKEGIRGTLQGRRIATMFFNELSLRAIHRPNANGQAFCMSIHGLSMFSASDFGFSMPLTRRRVQDVQARRVGQTKSDAKRQHIRGWEDGRKRTGPASADPV